MLSPEDERQEVLINLYRHDHWDERLLGEIFEYIYANVLHPRERFVLEEKVKGTPDEIIIKHLRRSSKTGSFTEGTYQDLKNEIKKKFKQGMTDELPWGMRRTNNEEEE